MMPILLFFALIKPEINMSTFNNYRNPDSVTYGRIRGSAAVVREEIEALWKDIEDVRCGIHYMAKNPYPLKPGLVANDAISCRERHTLENNLARDGRLDLQDRVNRLSDHFRQAVLYTQRAGIVISFDELMKLFDEMESQDPPVLPDIYVVNAGTHVCESWTHYKLLFERTVPHEIPADMKFFNQWLSVCSTFQEVGWVCDRAEDAGFPNLNHISREVVACVINNIKVPLEGDRGGHPLNELHSLKGYLDGKSGGVWAYLSNVVGRRIENYGLGTLNPKNNLFSHSGIKVRRNPDLETDQTQYLQGEGSTRPTRRRIVEVDPSTNRKRR